MDSPKKEGDFVMKMSTFDWIAWILVIIGALNWGLVAFNYNLVAVLVGSSFAQWIYGLVGLAGLYLLFQAITKKK